MMVSHWGYSAPDSSPLSTSPPPPIFQPSITSPCSPNPHPPLYMPPRKKQPMVARQQAPPIPSSQTVPDISYLMNSGQNSSSPQLPNPSQLHYGFQPFQAATPQGFDSQGLQPRWQPAQQHNTPLHQTFRPSSLPSYSGSSPEESENSDDNDDDEGMQPQYSLASAQDTTPHISPSVRSAQSATQSVRSAQSATQSVRSTMASMQLSGTPLPSQTPQPSLSEFTPSQQTQQTQSSQKKNLQWTGAMEKSAIKLYVKLVESGEKSDQGFKAQFHRWVAEELNKQYPGNNFDEAKCKSKLNQVCTTRCLVAP
ncbi:hypothetical protein PGT21_022856 [Puccinia graminis f. sp. tritici]|uniref:Myb/SANT-like domain-containing protein n=1 Tax=Puccinia graminis f. sp. tritici TaxID=56615 RepID=A0A5B0MLK8_PUCGR|nr:hypothetical protein PGT21_022856 [Puccinia graminis f. sp. tritici]KAA1078856.1 hypothetical protein PGTUg99_009810 [Puccinia graminis f. sp. tritici]